MDYSNTQRNVDESTSFDVADYLKDERDIVEYLNIAIESGDVSDFFSALGNVARSEGMTLISQKTGLQRESLYKSLNKTSSPQFNTINKVLHAMGLKISIQEI